MQSVLTTVALPVALGIIMFGLGLSLTIGDFARIGKHPKAVFIALFCQILLLPAICFALVIALQLPPVLAVGMMLLAASPGGTTANLYSHLFRGDIALNISLTAINSVLSVLTLPLVVNFALWYFKPDGAGTLGIDLVESLKVFAIVLVPVALGMLVRWRWPGFAKASDRPVRIASMIILAVVIVGAVVSNREAFFANLGSLALVTVSFCIISLLVGYFVPRLFRVERSQAIASAFEVGIHNATLAIVIAQSVLGVFEMSLPGAVYGVLMFFLAAAFGFAIRGRRTRSEEPIDVTAA